MIRRIFLSLFLVVSFVNTINAEQVTIQADITVKDECPDYSAWSKRTLITELKKLKTDIFLYYAGQVPCALLSLLATSGAVICTAKIITKDWPPLAFLGSIACAGISPAFAAWCLSLENKKILTWYNIDEINEQLALINASEIA